MFIEFNQNGADNEVVSWSRLEGGGVMDEGWSGGDFGEEQGRRAVVVTE